MKPKTILIIILLMVFIQSNISSGQESEQVIPDNLVEITRDNLVNLSMLYEFESDEIESVAWSESGTLLGIAVNNKAIIYDVLNLPNELMEIEYSSNITHLEFISNSEFLLINDVVYDLSTLAEVAVLPGTAFATNDSGNFIAGYSANEIFIFDLSNLQIVHSFRVPSLENCELACYVSDGAFNSSSSLLVISTPTAERGYFVLEDNQFYVSDVVGLDGLGFLPDSNILISWAGDVGYYSQGILISDIEEGEILDTIEITGLYSPISLSSDENLFVVSSLDDEAPNPEEAASELSFFELSSLRLFSNAETNEPIYSLVLDEPIVQAEFAPFGTLLAVLDATGDLTLWGVN